MSNATPDPARSGVTPAELQELERLCESGWPPYLKGIGDTPLRTHILRLLAHVKALEAERDAAQRELRELRSHLHASEAVHNDFLGLAGLEDYDE